MTGDKSQHFINTTCVCAMYYSATPEGTHIQTKSQFNPSVIYVCLLSLTQPNTPISNLLHTQLRSSSTYKSYAMTSAFYASK